MSRFRSLPRLALLTLLGLLVSFGSRGDESDPPGAREVDALVEEYLRLDGKRDDERARGDEILARLESLAPLTAAEARAWRKKITRLWGEGPKLETKSGTRYLDEDAETGLYLVGGETKRPKGLFIGLHGGTEGVGDANSAHGHFHAAALKRKWVAIFPQVRRKVRQGWTRHETEEFVLELIDRARRTWKIDPDHVYLGGHSMGGYGTWTLGGHHADRFAGLIPAAGAPTPFRNGQPVAPVGRGVIPNLRNTRLVIYQSEDDPNVKVEWNRAAVAELEEARERWGGFDFEYWEVTGQGHGAPPGGFRALVEKIAEAEREPRPEMLVWEQSLPWKRHFAWLWCDAPRAGTLLTATLDRETNTVRVTGPIDGLGLCVLLDDELLDLDRDVVVRHDEEERFRGRAERTLVALLSSGASGDPRLTFDARIRLER